MDNLNNNNSKITNTKYFTAVFGGLLSAASQSGGNYLFLLREAYLFLFALILKSSEKFKADFIVDILALDCLSGKFRFYVAYILRSATTKSHFIMHVGVREGAALASITNLFCGAVWPEREVWEKTGVYYFNNPDFRRLLTDYGFKGHPLRKDFPMSGYLEVFYDYFQNGLVFEKVEFAQMYRKFDFQESWDYALSY